MLGFVLGLYLFFLCYVLLRLEVGTREVLTTIDGGGGKKVYLSYLVIMFSIV